MLVGAPMSALIATQHCCVSDASVLGLGCHCQSYSWQCHHVGGTFWFGKHLPVAKWDGQWEGLITQHIAVPIWGGPQRGPSPPRFLEGWHCFQVCQKTFFPSSNVIPPPSPPCHTSNGPNVSVTFGNHWLRIRLPNKPELHMGWIVVIFITFSLLLLAWETFFKNNFKNISKNIFQKTKHRMRLTERSKMIVINWQDLLLLCIIYISSMDKALCKAI